ncbi:MAG TPA: hypothetical protein VFN39_13275 [Gemmatimonadaceae bacterium]|nr:hypothetical protein [Gemmatimonadaceae bacterium]
MRYHYRYAIVAALAGATLVAACESATVPDLNAPSTTELAGPLTQASVQRLVSGLVDNVRRNAGLGYFYFGEAFARDAYRFDPSESRYIYEAYTSAPSRTSFFGASQYNGFYGTIRAGTTIIKKLKDTPTTTISAPEQAAIRGFVRTFQALEYYHVEEYHDTLGTPIQLADSSKLGPIYCPKSALAAISSLLDSANIDLAAAVAAGVTTFPFELPSGFVVNGNFTDVTTFRKTFNRGLKGKVEVYRGIGRNNDGVASSFDVAIAALDTAIGPTPTTMAQLNVGPYFQYSTAPGEFPNPIADQNLRINQRVGDSVQAGDLRASKIVKGDLSSYTARGFKYQTQYYPAVSLTTRPANFVNPIGILRVEELVLLRAQAKIGKGDLVGALQDINTVRTISGGLAPLPPFVATGTLTATQVAIKALLYEKRYSLLLEGPQRLVDLRAYKMLNAANLPKEVVPNPITGAGDRFNSAFFIPQSESDVRGGNVAPVCP